jgi:hypothetical protein
MTTEETWRTARLVFRLPDNAEMRLAFLQGARFVLSALIDDLEAFDSAERINEELIIFGRGI